MLYLPLCPSCLLLTCLPFFTTPHSCLSLVTILRWNKLLPTKFLRPKLSSSTGITLSIEPRRRHIRSFRVIIDQNFQAACIVDGPRALSKVFGAMLAIIVRVTVKRERLVEGGEKEAEDEKAKKSSTRKGKSRWWRELTLVKISLPQHQDA